MYQFSAIALLLVRAVIVIYTLYLATRLVLAVERIAARPDRST